MARYSSRYFPNRIVRYIAGSAGCQPPSTGTVVECVGADLFPGSPCADVTSAAYGSKRTEGRTENGRYPSTARHTFPTPSSTLCGFSFARLLANVVIFAARLARLIHPHLSENTVDSIRERRHAYPHQLLCIVVSINSLEFRYFLKAYIYVRVKM